MAATVRGAELLVYLSEDLDTGDAEAGFFAEMKNAAVGFVSDPRLKHASALNPILVVKPSAWPSSAKRIVVTVDAEVAESRASNVLGMIEGSDPALRDEWIVLSAHYDHIGSHDVPEGQDGIWNGADDNASGAAATLELARQLAQRPGKRSVLIFFTSGEDRGIFGSAYYSIEPVVPMDRVAIQFNLDMVGRSTGKLEAHVHGAARLFDQAVTAGRNHGIDVIADQQPTWRLVYLTDTYHFARAGVPSLFFFTGFHPDYHQPSDTADKIAYDELSRITRIAGDLVRSYADGAAKPAYSRPSWFVTP
ncbi:MAG: M28 family peptidase [bacterium]|nr:M28 family peptidase [bacterium]